MVKAYKVVVCFCTFNRGHICYSADTRQDFDSADEAVNFAKEQAKAEKSVIVRPRFNEQGFFREWRSFDGGPFRECRWECHVTGKTPSLSADAVSVLLAT